MKSNFVDPQINRSSYVGLIRHKLTKPFATLLLPLALWRRRGPQTQTSYEDDFLGKKEVESVAPPKFDVTNEVSRETHEYSASFYLIYYQVLLFSIHFFRDERMLWESFS